MNLNDDCLLHIFNLLHLRDQIAAARTCQRFRDLLVSLWQRRCLEFSLTEYKLNIDEKPAVFLKSICSTVQKMDLNYLNPEQMDILKAFSYPALKNLKVRITSHITNTDEFVLEMTVIFPNLRSFHASFSNVSGKHIEKWRCLENLNFTGCTNVRFSYFEKILEELNLKSVALDEFYDSKNITWTSPVALQKFCDLEEISLRCKDLTWVPDPSLFSNLKVLELCGNMDSALDLIRYIVEHKNNDLVELHVGTSSLFESLFVRTFKNLEKVVITMHVVPFIIKCTPNLREIIFQFCVLQKNDIFRWLNYTQIERMSVEQCWCSFDEPRVNVQDIMKHRTTALHFNFYKNIYMKGGDDKKVDFYDESESPLLKITQESVSPYRHGINNFCRFRFL